MDMSLDEIIKKNKIPKTQLSNKRRLPTKTDQRRPGVVGRKGPLNGRINKSPRQPLPSQANSKLGTPVDARLKIIQKNRQRLTDAREKLSEIAKQTDARSKIKARKMAKGSDRQGIDRQSRGRGRGRGSFSNISTRQLPIVLQRSVMNNVAENMRDPSSMIRCTINRPVSDFSRSYDDMMDVEESPPLRRHADFGNIQVALKNEYGRYDQEFLSGREPYKDRYEPPMYRDTSRSSSRIAEPRRMSQKMRARLDTPVRPRYSRSPSPPPSQPQGHRIVVSNLQTTVTHEDIKELFEDIGPLITSRLVRAGTAEVIYKSQKDAKKAVDLYHNRQLDGQPMKCLLVNPRTSSSSGVLRSNNMSVAPKYPVSSKSMVIPDLTAIHKALFTTK